MRISVLVVVTSFLMLLIFTPTSALAKSCGDGDSCASDSDPHSCYQQVKDDCESRLSAAKSQEKTLKSQLDYIDAQTRLTQAKIDDTNYQITKLETEITDLSGRITKLSANVDSISELLLVRITQTYKQGEPSILDLIFSSHGFADLLERMKYIQVAQANDKKVLYQLQATKAAYHDQKTDKETRQAQEEKLKKDLVVYQTQLADQKKAKQQLLAATQGDESNYEKLIAQAEAQLAAFRSFVQSQGGLTLINADPSWPAGYFSQRDVRWGNMAIGNSRYSIGLAGCLVSSVAMVLTHRGNSQTPATIGSNDSYFFDGDFLWSALTSLGFNSPSRTTNTSTLDNALSAGKWAIVGIGYTSSTYAQPFHFVVVTSKNGDDYNLLDPWKGPNVSFKSNYSGNYITEIITY